MTLKLNVIYLLVLLVLPLAGSWAQCPTANSYVTSTTAASCPSNGIMAFSNPDDVPVMGGGMGISGAIYTITAGPATGGYQTSGQSANKFEGLPPDTYTVTISKPGCPDVVKSNVVIGSTYSTLNLTASVSNQCANSQPGGTITTTLTGGKAPIEYAFILSNDASIDDRTLTYGPSSSTTVASFGTYQVRARDACGAFVTRSVTVSPLSAKAYFNATGTNKDCNTYAMDGSLVPTAGGNNITPSASVKYTIELFDVSSTNPCTIPSGAIPFQTITADDASDLKFDLAKTHGSIVVRTTSPCGEVDVRCFNLATSIGPTISAQLAPSCAQLNGSNEEAIRLITSRFTVPLSVTISSRATGTPVLQTDAGVTAATKTYTVPYVAEGYIVQVVDACSQARSLTISSPPSVSSNITGTVTNTRTCANQLGAKRTSVVITGGATGLFDTNSKVVLIAGPSGSISPTKQSDGSTNNSYYWNNLAPGTYTAQIISTTAGCGPTSFTFAVPVNSTSSPGLSFTLTGTATQLCGGNDDLTTSFNYNGPNSVTYVITNSSSQTIATNTTGTFSNLAPGVYSVKATANTGCNNVFTQTQSFTLTQADAEPAIAKKIGVICESGGVPTATGQAFFQFTGVVPYRFERRLTGTTTWSTVSSGIATNTYAVTGLSANSTYDFRLTDNCGKSTVTTVSIKPLNTQKVENTLQPCVGNAYTLSAPDLVGAIYSWTKDGQFVSSNRQIVFSPYQTSDDGQYITTIMLGNGCVAREAKVTLNSTSCNQPLPVNLLSFKAIPLNNSTIEVNWQTAREVDNAYFLIQRSKDLINFETITRVQPSEKGLSGSSYQYIDAAPYMGTSYYRLEQVDLSGKVNTFPAVSVILRREAYRVYPNPVTESQFTLNLDEPQFAKIQLYSADGRSINLQRTVLGPNLLSLESTGNLATGVYHLLVEERGHQKSYRLVFKR